MKIAIVHDFLNQYGGAEKTLEIIHELYPEAPVFTSIFIPEKFPSRFATWDIHASFMQRLPFLGRHFKKYLMLYPRAMESFDLSAYDVVISSSSAFAKGVRVRPGALHVSYCYTPMRFVWAKEHYFEKERILAPFRWVLPWALTSLKRWDLKTSQGVHDYIAISEHIRRRIRDAYGRESRVIYPPVEVDRFSISKDIEDYYLIVSRLNPYKNVDLAIHACNEMGRRLVIIGTGPYEPTLRKIAGPSIEFKGRVSDEELPKYISSCRAFLFPGEEDFGIAPVEAMAAGRPVIAYGRGGALETVVDGVSGHFFNDLTVNSLKEAMARTDRTSFEPERIRQNAQRFSVAEFKTNFSRVMQEVVAKK